MGRSGSRPAGRQTLVSGVEHPRAAFWTDGGVPVWSVTLSPVDNV
jgi:hypothetical protein